MKRVLNYIEPDSIKKNREAHSIFLNFIKELRETYKKFINLGIEKEDARFVLPYAVENQIVVSANLR